MNKSIFLPIIFFNFFVKWENMSGDALDMEAIKRILSRMTDMLDRIEKLEDEFVKQEADQCGWSPDPIGGLFQWSANMSQPQIASLFLRDRRENVPPECHVVNSINFCVKRDYPIM